MVNSCPIKFEIIKINNEYLTNQGIHITLIYNLKVKILGKRYGMKCGAIGNILGKI
jgi:hypothetical protein